MKTLLSFLFIAAAIIATAQVNITTNGSAYTINFDATLADVMEGQFAGAGLQSTPATGELDADAWEITGCSDGDFLYGATNLSGDAARGASTGSVTTGGIYAFDVTGTGDHALGIQPGGSDMTPGMIVLRLTNNTGGYIGSIDLDYEAWMNNDQERSNSLSIAYSYDNADFVDVPAYDFATIEASDANGWVSSNQSGTIDGLFWPDGTDLYLAWTTDDISGSGSRDEIAIDDIAITTNVMEPTVQFDDVQFVEWEDQTSVNVDLSLVSNNGTASAIKVVAMTESTATTADYSMATGIDFAGTTDETISFTINLTDDMDVEADEYIILVLQDSANAVAGEDSITGVYIMDDDNLSPTGTGTITLAQIGNYAVTTGSCEISAYDTTTMKLFTANSTNNEIEVIDMSDPYNMTNVTTIDVSSYGDLNSVTVYNDTVVVACANSTDVTLDGEVAFFQGDGTFISQVTVGANPDMVTYSPDHTEVLVANEGEPNDNYTADPEGTISIIDVTAGVANATVNNINFNGYDGMETALEAEGARIFGPGASVSEDLEPEYIAFSPDETMAYISCQENNAIAVLDMANDTIIDIIGLGYKDHSVVGNEIDASNDSYDILFANWPTLGMYQPDAIATYEVGASSYIVTANEGDARDYAGYSEEDRVGDLDLDDTQFGDFEHFLLVDENLGRTKTTYANGDTGGDNDYDEIYTYGARSFSIWDDAGNLVYDSGSELERITADDPKIGDIFNCTDDGNGFKNRSDDKGPEPEGVAIGTINDTVYAFIGLERVGGVMVYDITDPTDGKFVQYINTRDTATVGGDLAPEGIFFLSAEESPIDTALVVVSYEVSGTVGVFKIDHAYPSQASIDENNAEELTLEVYPNPASEFVFFNEMINAEILDVNGQVVRRFTKANKVNVADLSNGIYMVRTNNGQVAKFVKQ